MAVGISEVAGVHEAMVLYWIDVGGAAIAAAARSSHRQRRGCRTTEQASLRSTFLVGWDGS
jgi:hypothetical protein